MNERFYFRFWQNVIAYTLTHTHTHAHTHATNTQTHMQLTHKHTFTGGDGHGWLNRVWKFESFTIASKRAQRAHNKISPPPFHPLDYIGWFYSLSHSHSRSRSHSFALSLSFLSLPRVFVGQLCLMFTVELTKFFVCYFMGERCKKIFFLYFNTMNIATKMHQLNCTHARTRTQIHTYIHTHTIPYDPAGGVATPSISCGCCEHCMRESVLD